MWKCVMIAVVILVASCSTNPPSSVTTPQIVSGALSQNIEKEKGVWVIPNVPDGVILAVEGRNPNPGYSYHPVSYQDHRPGTIYIYSTRGDLDMGFLYRITVEVP